YVVSQVFLAYPRGLAQPSESLVELFQIVQFLGDGVAKKHAGAVIDVTARQLRAQLLHVIGLGRLDAQLRTQQVARVLRSVELNGPIAGLFRLRKPANTALARCEIVPEPRILRRQGYNSLVQHV